MSQITSYYSLRGEVSFVKLHRVPLRGVARVGSVLDHAEVDIDRVYSVQCGDGEPMVLYQSPVTAMWETFQVCVACNSLMHVAFLTGYHISSGCVHPGLALRPRL